MRKHLRERLCCTRERNAFCTSLSAIKGTTRLLTERAMEPNYKMTARVLVVDDDEAVRSTLKIVLETNGYEVCTAASVAEARHVLPLERFDLVLTDMKMESEDSGYEVVRMAREQAYRPTTVIVTAFPLLAQEWRKAGADAVLHKPTSITEILCVLEQLMVLARAR